MGWGGVLECTQTGEHSFKTTMHDHFQKATEAKLSAGETNTHIAMPSAPAPQSARSGQLAIGPEPQLKTTSVLDGRHEDSTMEKKLSFYGGLESACSSPSLENKIRLDKSS